MQNQNLKTLKDIINKGTILTAEQVESFLTTILDFLAKNKQEFDMESSERLSEMKEVMKYIEVQHKEILKDWENKLDSKTTEAYNKVKNGFDKEITKAKEIIQELRSIKLQDGYTPVKGVDYFDGKDADETKIVAKVLKKLPKSKDYSAVGIKDMLESLEDDDRLDFGVLKNVPDFSQLANPIMAGAGGRLLSQMNDVDTTGITNNSVLIWDEERSIWVIGTTSAGSGTVTSIATGTGLTGGTITTTGTISLSTPLQPIATLTGNSLKVLRVNAGETAVEYATISTGTPGGSTTQLQYNNAGSFGGISGATTNGTAVTYTTGNLIATDVKASGSGGLQILSSAGTVTALFGAGAGANSTLYGGTKLDYATASTIAILDASKNLISAATATYPDLTELSYVKGVTSSIQTQLNTKGSGTVTNTGGSLTANSVVLGAGTNDTKVVAGITTDGISKLNLGVPGSSVGAVVFGNATSNTITLQPVTGNLGPSVLSLPAATDTLVGRSTSDTLSNKILSFPVIANIVNTGILTLPTSTDTLVARDTTDTLTNKSMSGSTNTFTNIPLSSAVTGTLPVANGGTGQTTYTNGQLLIGNTTGNTLTKATLTGTANQVIITNGAGSITLSIPQDIATTSNPQFATIELGNVSDTTLSRVSAGVMAVEGVTVATSSNTLTFTNKILRNTVEPSVDDTYTGEDLTGFNATATIAQWDAVYLSTTGWALTDADSTSTAGGVCVGLAAASGTNGNPLTVVTRGVIRNDGWTWTTVGAPLYLSTTAGALTETAPSGTDDVIRVVGYVMSDDCIFFCPSTNWIVHV